MPNQLDFVSSVTAFGPTVTNIQATMNAIFSFVGVSSSSAYNVLPTWPTNNFGTSTDTLFSRVEAIDAAFAASGSRAFRANKVALASGVTSATGAFSAAFATSGYIPEFSFSNTVDSSPIFLQGMITYLAATGFVVTLNAPTDSVNYVMNYQANGVL